MGARVPNQKLLELIDQELNASDPEDNDSDDGSNYTDHCSSASEEPDEQESRLDQLNDSLGNIESISSERATATGSAPARFAAIAETRERRLQNRETRPLGQRNDNVGSSTSLVSMESNVTSVRTAAQRVRRTLPFTANNINRGGTESCASGSGLRQNIPPLQTRETTDERSMTVTTGSSRSVTVRAEEVNVRRITVSRGNGSDSDVEQRSPSSARARASTPVPRSPGISRDINAVQTPRTTPRRPTTPRSTQRRPSTPRTTPRRRASASYVGKDGTKWAKSTSGPTRPAPHNILRQAGPRPNLPDTVALVNPIDSVMLFLRPILHIIVMFTNIEAIRVYTEKQYARTWTPVDETEISAYIGLLILSGVLGQSMIAKITLWTARYGPPIFRATLSFQRFKEIRRFMRFDDRATRDANDKFSAIRELWTVVDNLLGRYYIPGENLTIDEQLVPYNGRCGFKQYMPSKPDKYGIKFWWICDSKSFYPLHGLPYLGKEDNQRAAPGLGRRVVLALVQAYRGSGRNITCDNYFTDLMLAEALMADRLSLVGTLRQNKTFIPPEFKPDRKRVVESSIFGFRNHITLVSYVPNKGRAVILLSTRHFTDSIDANTRKPEIIMSYNKNKGGVDSLDQLVHQYTCRQPTRRWPIACFFNVIDIVCVAAYVIWTHTYPHWNFGKNEKRRLFLVEIAEELVQPHIRRRLETCNRRETVRAMEQAINAPNRGMRGAGRAARGRGALRVNGRRRCHVCPWRADRKTRHICSTCFEPVCSEHSNITRICSKCM